ncbi:hypothetical protein [Streptomyces kanamyceticus]|uniref:hypothetical protein n=1 Tax=Streptomyces kanamyceticus TaxID=1967 RepID=UPI0037DD4DA0
MALAPFRLVWLALWVEASPEENAALTEHLRTALIRHGDVAVHARGPFHRTPEMLHFEVDLKPHSTTSDCLRALGFTWDEDFGWSEWERPVNGGAFLHPAVYGAQAGEMEAAAAPRFETGDIVRVRNSDEARRLGLAGSKVAVLHPQNDEEADPSHRTWRYSVHIEGQEETGDLDESSLEPTGRRVQLYNTLISVNDEGALERSADRHDAYTNGA